MERNDVIIAQVLGAPIDPNLKAPVALAEVCELETAQPGELVRIFNSTAEDVNEDDIYSIDANGELTLHKVSPVAPATLAFSGLQSKLEYVLIDEILPAADQDALGRKKAAIARAMDKKEVKMVLDGCLALVGQEVTMVSGEDLYDLIVKMVHFIEDYADNYVLVAGSLVKEKIDTYDKENADNFHYRVGLKEYLVSAGIKVIKATGKLNGAAILATDKLILVGRDSQLAAGKPITFVRRLMSPEIAKMMNSESTERAISVAQAPTVISAGGKNTLGYGTFGYESVIATITNKRAIAWATLA